MSRPQVFRRTSSPRFDRGQGVALADEIALDHRRPDVERIAASAAAAVLAWIVRSGAPRVTSLSGTLRCAG